MLGDIRDPLQLAWAAGFFDGEGCTYLGRHKKRSGNVYYSIVMSVGQREPVTLQRFLTAVGVGTVGGPWAAGNPRQKNPQPRYRWSVRTTSNSMIALKALWPYLSPEKKKQARRVIAEWKEIPDAWRR